jgi:hypothetical protein
MLQREVYVVIMDHDCVQVDINKLNKMLDNMTEGTADKACGRFNSSRNKNVVTGMFPFHDDHCRFSSLPTNNIASKPMIIFGKLP